MNFTDSELRIIFDMFELSKSEYTLTKKAVALGRRIARHLGVYKENLSWLDHTAWLKLENARSLACQILEARRPPVEKDAERAAAQAKWEAMSPNAKLFLAAMKAVSKPIADPDPESDPPQEIARRLPKRALKPAKRTNKRP